MADVRGSLRPYHYGFTSGSVRGRLCTVNRTYIKPDHAAALEQDAKRLMVNPTDVLDAILNDFFRGWDKPVDRMRFYTQVSPVNRKSIVVTPDAAKALGEWIGNEVRNLDHVQSDEARRCSRALKQVLEQL